MTVRTRQEGHVAVVTFDRPPHNFADLALIAGIGAAFDAADADGDVRCILLRSAGRVFCAGADLEIGFGEGLGGESAERVQDHRDGYVCSSSLKACHMRICYGTFTRPTGRRAICMIRSPPSLIGK